MQRRHLARGKRAIPLCRHCGGPEAVATDDTFDWTLQHRVLIFRDPSASLRSAPPLSGEANFSKPPLKGEVALP